MKKSIFILSIISVLFFASCDELFQDMELSEDEIVDGLKTALTYGADSASTELNQEDGYYGNSLLKIKLPAEAEPMLEYVEIIENGSDELNLAISAYNLIAANDINFETAGNGFVENTILNINRSAEKAAKDAKPIFVDAITSMSIDDGLNILQGKSEAYSKAAFDSTAATQYLKYKTYESLVNVYSPKIDSTLDLVALNIGDKETYTTNQLWQKLVNYYNNAVIICNLLDNLNLLNNYPKLKALSQEPQINAELSLGQFATEKALDGLFYKVGDEEKKIRRDPFAWVSDILQKVFGSVYVETDEAGN